MKPFVVLSLCALVLTACNPQAQFITLRGSNVKPTDDGLVLDTDTLSLRYQFYSERGVIHLTVFNKLDRPLYVNWKKSAFIIGSDKLDYWYDVATVNLTGSAYSYRYSRYATVGLGGTITKDDPVGFIPPKTQLEKYEFVVVPGEPLRLTRQPKLREETRTNLYVGAESDVVKKKKITVSQYEYPTPEQSPLQFRNFLTFSTRQDFQTEFYVDTKFWASGVQILPKTQLLGQPIVAQDGRIYYDSHNPYRRNDSFYVVLPDNPQ